MTYLAEIFVAYILADLLSGLYHLITDRGWNIRSQVELFQFHHKYPARLGFDMTPTLVGLPLIVLAVKFGHIVFFAALAIAISLAQVPHYFAHHRGNRLVRLLQRLWIIIPPRQHAKHHRNDFGENYCVLSGWNNFWFNKLIQLWR